MPWATRAKYPIPASSSQTKEFELNDYSLGMNSFVSNDVLKDGYLRLAQDARINTLGEYETRKGFDFHSVPAGETEDQTITSTTGAADKSFGTTTRLAQTFTTAAAGKLSKISINIKNDASALGTVVVELWSNSGGEPSALLAKSTIDAADVDTTYSYLTARFASAPTLANTTAYWIVAYIQSNGSGSYKWSSTTSATTALASSDGGSTWDTTTYALNFRESYATSAGVKGLVRAYKSDGTKVTIFAHGTSLYTVNDVTGALTAIKTGLSASATHYRFAVVNDVVYYVNGQDGYRKWDFTTESQVNATNYSNIVVHKGLIWLNRTADPNRWDFSNFADYETFTSTDFIYVPSPKTGDPSTAVLSLNGYLLLWTKNKKYILSGDDNATFRLDDAPDQKGTYSQETVTADDNYAYYLSDDGVYQTNGTQPKLLSENNYEDILTLANKDDTCINVNRGRLRMWYRSAGSSVNDRCWVWNLNYSSQNDTIESLDTDAYVTRAFSSFNDNDDLLVGSSVVGQAHWQELESNDYDNLGGDINYMLQLHYNPYGRPAVEKEVRYWKARFGAQSDDYTIACEYAYDLRDNWQVVDDGTVSVQGSGAIWGSGILWGAFTWGTTATVQANLYVPGEYRRIAVRYKHYAARQPHRFLGHSFVVQLRRMK